MIPRSDYHTAHKPPVRVAVPHDHFHGCGITAIHHDLTAGPLPNDFGHCDVFVADLPWRKGFDEFNRRAGIADGRGYLDFMKAVSELVKGSGILHAPTYLVTGRHALPYLPTPDIVLPMRLNEDDAIAIGYRPGMEAFGDDYGNSQEFLYSLAQHYTVAGDFCAGYGRTGRFFARAGKRAVLSDYNRECIGYIAQHACEWRKA